MSLAQTYIKSLQVAKTQSVLDALLPSIKRNWSGFTDFEKGVINKAGQEARERIKEASIDKIIGEDGPFKSVEPARPEPAPVVQDEPAEMPNRALFDQLTERYARCATREEVRAVRAEVEELQRTGHLRTWQSRELFVSDIAALRRVFELDPPQVSTRTRELLDALTAAQSFTEYDAVLREAWPYSLELERQDSREWWVLEHAFELRSAELRQQAKQQKQQAKIPF